RSLKAFQERFGDEAACLAYLAACRWPEGYVCGRCRQTKAFELTRRQLWQGTSCGSQPSVTAGTVRHRTRMPLTRWFEAAYVVTTHTPGLSALQLQRQLGRTSYETAWARRHKRRRAMGRPERDALKEKVEVDEVDLGGPDVGLKGGRPLLDNALGAGAVEVRGKGSGRVRLHVGLDASAASLTGFVAANVECGAVVLTEGWGGYLPLQRMGYRHHATTPGTPERAAKILPRVHRVFGNRQTWLRGTHHGVGTQHLQAYLNECTFRFNRRRTPMAAFQTLLGLATVYGPTTYKILYGSELAR
ncbi:MAG: IS1595 family transposase, partial [Nitrospirota bacterium]